MRIATTSLYNIMSKHIGHKTTILVDGDEICVYCLTCKEAILIQQKPTPQPQIKGWRT